MNQENLNNENNTYDDKPKIPHDLDKIISSKKE